MGEVYAKAQKEKLNQSLNEILAMLEEMKGTSEGDDFQIGKQKILARLEEMIAEDKRPLSTVIRTNDGWDFSKEKGEDILAEDDIVRLRPFSAGDERFYFQIREKYRIFNKENIPEEKLIAGYWDETQQRSAFYCVIERVSDVAKMGYIALKDTSKDMWEIAIELDSAYCHQGYGTRAIMLFLQKIGKITPKRQFQFLVEVDNIPCQSCMKKLNAELVGIHNLAFDCEEDAETFAANNLNMITEHMKTLAGELDVPPQKLLSHVLDYRVAL
ncbi:N-acetyltransferase [bacterium 1xD42-67]|nr:N-acetyltransferase [bacterium 1xD42-67]